MVASSMVPELSFPRVYDLRCCSSYFGMQRMKQLAQTAVYWLGIDADIMELCHRCTACAEHQKKPPKPANHPWMLPEKPWSRVHVDHAINFLGCDVSILQHPHPPSPLLSYWSKTSPTLATLIPLCQTMLLHSPLRNSKASAVREALPTSQGHHTILQQMVLPNVWFRHSSRHSQSPRFHLVQPSRNF